MDEILTCELLDLYLSDLKNMLKNKDYSNFKKIVFLNMDSFINHMNYTCGVGSSGMTFRELILSIEPYIPVMLDESALECYINLPPCDDAEQVRQVLVNNAKTLFYKSLCNARSDKEWDEITEVCRMIRAYKDAESYSAHSIE